MHLLTSIVHVLAAGEGPKAANIWNPTIIGILTVLSAIGLFCGSVYLLLATNLGARLGFLVAAAGLTGFMLLLATLWWTAGSSGIDPPHGSTPQWSVVGVVSSPSDSKVNAVQTIAEKGSKLTSDQLVNLKPAIDAAIVPATSVNGETPPARPFATLGFSSTTDYITDAPHLRAYTIGGGTNNLFWHKHQYAAVEICPAQQNVIPATCDPLQDTHFIILSHNLGSLRQPVVFFWFFSLAFFILSMLGLHWYEKDLRERKKHAAVGGLTPVPTPGA